MGIINKKKSITESQDKRNFDSARAPFCYLHSSHNFALMLHEQTKQIICTSFSKPTSIVWEVLLQVNPHRVHPAREN